MEKSLSRLIKFLEILHDNRLIRWKGEKDKMILEYLPYVLLFALATIIVYGWGMWRSMRQKQDLSNMLSAKGSPP